MRIGGLVSTKNRLTAGGGWHVASLRRALAWCILGLLVVAWFTTLEPETRMGRISSALRNGAPTWHCLSGYDDRGACVLSNLAGGVHGFFLPGLLAASVAVVGGLLAGILAGYDRSPVKSWMPALLGGLEAVPRLAVLMLVFVMFEHSPVALGMALGLTSIPGVAEQLAESFYRLQQRSYMAAARHHGIRETRLLFVHLIWLECRPILQQQAVMTFGLMLLAESSLSFALRSNTSPTELSWGTQLYLSTSALYHPSWRTLPPFLAIVTAFLGVMWATWELGSSRDTSPVPDGLPLREGA